MENIFIRFYQQEDHIEWFIPKKDDGLTRGALQEAAEYCTGHQVVVVLPGNLVSYHQIDLPKLKKDKLYQALPFALEDKLADDISKLHFSVDTVSKGVRRVAVIDREIFKGYLEKLSSAGIDADVIISDDEFIEQLCLQHKDKNIILIDKSADLIHVAAKDGSVLNFSTDLLSNYLEILKSKEGFGDIDAEWILYKCPSCEDLAKAISAQLNVITPEEIPDDSLIFFSEQWSVIKKPVNLLQDEFEKVSSSKNRNILLGLIAVMSIFLLIIPLIGKLIVYQKYATNAKSIDNAVIAEYKKIFPKDTKFIEPRIMIAREIKKLEKNQLKISDFETLINAFASKYKGSNNITVKELAYQDKKITFNIEAPDFAALDSLTRQLKLIKNIKTKEDMVASQGNKFSGRINMSIN